MCEQDPHSEQERESLYEFRTERVGNEPYPDLLKRSFDKRVVGEEEQAKSKGEARRRHKVR
jgi:hypothetical protein